MKQCKICYSYAVNHHCHGRDGSDPELCDVCYWRTRADKMAAIIQFCEVEMGWEFFRAEFQIGDNPSKSLENAMKLRKFLSANA